jgi:hypothetical protein
LKLDSQVNTKAEQLGAGIIDPELDLPQPLIAVDDDIREAVVGEVDKAVPVRVTEGNGVEVVIIEKFGPWVGCAA